MNKYQKAFCNIDCKIISGKGAGQSYVNGQYKYDYRAIIELVNKATPMKPIVDYAGEFMEVNQYYCPICKEYLDNVEGDFKYCPRCGQALDWGDSNE